MSAGDGPERSAACDGPAPRASNSRRWLVAALVTLLFVVLLAREVGLDEIADRLRDFSPRAFLAATGWLALAGVVRALRLRLLLARPLGLGETYAFNQIYNVVTATVPAGIGEAASAWLLRRALHVPLHAGLVALFVGRFLDLFVLLALFLGVLATGLVGVEASGSLVLLAAALLAALLALGAGHLASRGRLASVLERWSSRDRIGPEPAPARHLRRATGLLAESLRTLPAGRDAAAVLLLTLATQLPSLAALHALLAGARQPLSYAAAIVCFVIYLLLRMLPLQGIGGVGTTAAWWAIALTMLGVPGGEAAVVGAVLYVAFYAILLLLCVTCLPLLAFTRRDA